MIINGDECTACGDCETVCPSHAISIRSGVFRIDAVSCTECEGDFDEPQCLSVCPIDYCIQFLED
ncbi:4Fe-4S dicluster domain-containing protein [Methylobacter sp.]